MIEKLKKKKWSLIVITILSAVIMIFNNKFVMYKLPNGEYFFSVDSPNQEYTLKAYRYPKEENTANIKIEVINNQTKDVLELYYKDNQENPDLKWLDDETVQINEMKLNINQNE